MLSLHHKAIGLVNGEFNPPHLESPERPGTSTPLDHRNWSGTGDSNPFVQFGRLMHNPSASPA